MAQQAGVRVVGLRELRIALGVVDERLPDELRVESRAIAETVRLLAGQKMRADFANPTGRAESSLRTFSTSRAAGVRAGGASVPYFGWLDFGGTIRHHGASHEHTATHLIRREFIARGRYLYPSADEGAVTVQPRVERMLDRLFVKAGFTD